MIKTPKNTSNVLPYRSKNIFYYKQPDVSTIHNISLNTEELSPLFCETKEIYKKEKVLPSTPLENDVIAIVYEQPDQ